MGHMLWKVNIDGRCWVGDYRTKTNAIFGAMRADENKRRSWRDKSPTLVGVEPSYSIKGTHAKRIHEASCEP